MTARVDAWRAAGAFEDHLGHRVHVHVRAGDRDGPPLLFLHGYPSSSYDWRATLDRLPGHRAVCFDFLGFGLSAKPREHVYSLHAQADLAESVAARHLDAPAVLVAHDMGTSVATELLARDLEGRGTVPLAAVVLLNGSMVIERASLTTSQKVLRSRFGGLLARLSNERAFSAQFARLFSPGHPLTREESADQWALLAHARGHRILHRLTYYLHERVRFADRWHGALRNWPGRLELAWALRDPVCTEAVLEAVLDLRPSAPVLRLPELGHYPQLEDPETIAALIERVAATTDERSPR
jgi:pimeloyl-ACP methyl ester carboxylesterase